MARRDEKREHISEAGTSYREYGSRSEVRTEKHERGMAGAAPAYSLSMEARRLEQERVIPGWEAMLEKPQYEKPKELRSTSTQGTLSYGSCDRPHAVTRPPAACVKFRVLAIDGGGSK